MSFAFAGGVAGLRPRKGGEPGRVQRTVGFQGRRRCSNGVDLGDDDPVGSGDL